MILTITFNPAIDHTYSLSSDLEKDGVSRTTDSQFDAGGKGINVSTYLKALDAETAATGLLGGFTGDFIKSELDSQSLEHDFVPGGTTRINTTVIAGDNEYKINHSGPQTQSEAVDKIIEKIQTENPEKIVVSGSMPPGLNHSAIERIEKDVSAEIVLDLHGEILRKLSGNYLLCKPNREELSSATGIEVDSVEKCVEASEKLMEKGFENVLASLGDQGAVLSTKDENFYVESLEAEVADTTGAGDAMLSGMLSGLAEGKSKKEALKKSLAFATLVVETHGTSVPEMENLEDYIEKIEVKKV